jgi:hypothetical protein
MRHATGKARRRADGAKETAIEKRRSPSTIRRESSASPVVKLTTLPAPRACRSWTTR